MGSRNPQAGHQCPRKQGSVELFLSPGGSSEMPLSYLVKTALLMMLSAVFFLKEKERPQMSHILILHS